VTIDHLVIPQPIPWLLHRSGMGQPVKADAHEIIVVVQPGESSASAELPGMDLLQGTSENLVTYLPWIPVTSISRLQIVDPEGTELAELKDISLNGRMLKARWPGMSELPELYLQLFLADDSIRFGAKPVNTDWNLRLRMEISPGLSVPRGYAALYSNDIPLRVDAEFSSKSWIPDSVNAQGIDWPVPSGLFRRSRISVPDLLANLSFKMTGATYESDLHISGQGVLPGSMEDTAVADIRFKGDPESVEVSAFSIQADWLSAHLSQPVSYSIPGNAFSGSAELELEADLSKQDWIPAQGILLAKASIDTASIDHPGSRFSIHGDRIVVSDFSLPRVSLEGSMDLEKLEFEQMMIELGDKSRITASGDLFLKERTLAGQGSFLLEPSWLMKFVEGVEVLSPLSGEFQIRGPFTGLQHEGTIQMVNLQSGKLHPVFFSGEWSGQSISHLDLKTSLQSGDDGQANIDLQVEQNANDGTLLVEVYKAVLEDPHHGKLQLEEPVSIALDLKSERPLRSISRFRLSRENHYLSGEYDDSQETFSIEGEFVDLRLLENWFDLSVPRVIIEHLSLSVLQVQPFLEATFALRAYSTDERFEVIDFNMEGLFNDLGIHLYNLDARYANTPFINGDIGLPVQLHPFGSDSGNYLSAISGKSLEGSLEVDISSALFENIKELSFTREIPGIKIHVTAEGTADAPVAALEANLSNLDILELVDARLVDHPLENVHLSARLTKDLFSIQNFEANLDEGILKVNGDLPMESLWAVFSGNEIDWLNVLQDGQLRLQFDNFNATDFASVLPDYLRRTGRIDGFLEIKPGLNLEGALHARNFSLRPTLYFQTVDDINLSMDIKDSRLVISTAGASVGKSLVNLSGYIDYSNWKAPLYAIDLQGVRTPLIRTPDFLLHGDIDLHLRRMDSDTPALLTGDLNLRDGLLILDFEPLAARTAGQELPKPPFFSLDTAPFSEWLVDINVHGEEFLRLRSPYAKAVLSTQMNVTGALANPIWVGNVTTSEGTIDFPGVRMSLSRSEIFVTRENQSSLQLDLNSMGQMASYIVTLQVSGPMDDPHVEFASTPDLPNAQILQLLATGSTDGSSLGNVGLYLGKGLFNSGTGNSLWDRVSVEIGRDITESTKDTIDLYYDISDRLRLHGQYDKYDAQNLNLEWKVFSR